ncbi:hypothetical protein A2U01_0067075, partial [Trifolium medium]|nr:hypothetical protein [Trifolium medium]
NTVDNPKREECKVIKESKENPAEEEETVLKNGKSVMPRLKKDSALKVGMLTNLETIMNDPILSNRGNASS